MFNDDFYEFYTHIFYFYAFESLLSLEMQFLCQN